MLFPLQGSVKFARAEVSYGETYRFRLWLACVEDSAALKMGFRAYHSHITRSLENWSSGGHDLRSSKGNLLDWNTIQQDDLWGFLGKKDSVPMGPKRKISPEKLGIIDVYFKIKSPLLAASFAKENIGYELLCILQTFFPKITDRHLKYQDEIDQLNGIYLTKMDLSLFNIKQSLKNGKGDAFSASAFFIRSNKPLGYLVIHKITIPVKCEYFLDIDENKDIRRYASHHAPKQTMIYSGVGLIGTDISRSRINMSCIMRDRATYQPHLTELNLFLEDNNYDQDWYSGDEEYMPKFCLEFNSTLYMNKFLYCRTGNNFCKIAGGLGYPNGLSERIHEIYENLGSEV